jgi:hypothetical protein
MVVREMVAFREWSHFSCSEDWSFGDWSFGNWPFGDWSFGEWSFEKWSHSENGRTLAVPRIGRSENGRSEIGC